MEQQKKKKTMINYVEKAARPETWFNLKIETASKKEHNAKEERYVVISFSFFPVLTVIISAVTINNRLVKVLYSQIKTHSSFNFYLFCSFLRSFCFYFPYTIR